jgi:stage II sporulation protein D
MTQRNGIQLPGSSLLLLLLALLLSPLGCSQDMQSGSSVNSLSPHVRVRILENQNNVSILATRAPVVQSGADPAISLNLPPGQGVNLSLTAGGWQIGNQTLGTGELVIEPTRVGSVRVDGMPYRGKYRFVPVGPGRFDVVNDVEVDDYLMGVIAKELLSNWEEETYKAQAIVARTYALYEMKTSPAGSYWDVYPDQRSQVYGGMAAETMKSRLAVEKTRGVVVAYGPPGQEKIFRAYFSSCCGGITQSAVDGFGFEEPHIAPLSDQNVHGLCSASPRFNWGPVVIRKDELTRRFRLFGARRTQKPDDIASAVKSMAGLLSIEVAPGGVNQSGRPVRFIVTDVRKVKYSFTGEELRTAINTDAPKDSTVYSSFFKIVNDVDSVHFVEGHGWGHGVGMCQWCAEARAELGMRHEDIVLAAFQRAVLVKAYD